MRHEQTLFIGIMSGTSADGIDIAIVRFDETNHGRPELIQFSEFPIPAQLRHPILKLAAGDYENSDAIEIMGDLDRQLGKAYGDYVLAAIHGVGLLPEQIAAIGCHGQTIRHRPGHEPAFTVQIGCAATVAEITGITTISDFRSRDIAADGEGAPLVPFAHRQLFAQPHKNVAVVNLGGIANVTWLGIDGATIGFDTGPGNMIMDGLMSRISGGRYQFDTHGALAASGKVSSELLEKLMAHPFLQRKPPKSTGREEFGEAMIELICQWSGLRDADRLATACRYTAETIANAAAFMPMEPASWLFCGGGTRNNELMRQLKVMLAPASVKSTEMEDIPPQAVEAVSFALLARQTLRGEPNTLAEVTGASHAVCGGQITPGNNWPALLAAIPTWTR